MQMALKNVCAQRSYRVVMWRPILELAKQALNEMAQLVKLAVTGNRLLAVDAIRNAGCNATLAKGVAVIAFVGDQDGGSR